MEERILTTTRTRLGMWAWITIFVWAVVTAGLSLLWLLWWRKKTFTLTTHRVIVRHGLIQRQERVTPLRNVQGIDVTIGPLAATVVVRGAGLLNMQVFGPVPAAAGRAIQAAYADLMNQSVPYAA